MDISKYALFADVADTKNFTRSGERLGYTQSGVSHILKAMERELGFPLFLRTRYGVALTSNAELLLPVVRNLLSTYQQLEETIHSLNGMETGHLTIASFSSISRRWLPAIIYAFQQKYPGIVIELLEGGTDDIVNWIENGTADFGLLSRRRADSLEWIPLCEDALMAILPQDYPLTHGDTFPIQEMSSYPFIISAEGVDYDIHYALEQMNIRPKIHLSSKDDHAIVSMVAHKLGVSILPQLVMEGINESILCLPLEPFFSRQLGIGVRSLKDVTPATKRFIDMAKSIVPDLSS